MRKQTKNQPNWLYDNVLGVGWVMLIFISMAFWYLVWIPLLEKIQRNLKWIFRELISIFFWGWYYTKIFLLGFNFPKRKIAVTYLT